MENHPESYIDRPVDSSEPLPPDLAAARAEDAVRIGALKNEMASSESSIFPLYKMIIDGKEHRLPLRDVSVAYDSGWVPVAIGGLVLEAAGQPREITNEERAKISDIADRCSESK